MNTSATTAHQDSNIYDNVNKVVTDTNIHNRTYVTRLIESIFTSEFT